MRGAYQAAGLARNSRALRRFAETDQLTDDLGRRHSAWVKKCFEDVCSHW
jgi:hypothetical protein